MLYCAFRLRMPWRRYLAEHDPADHLTWWEWFRLHRWNDMSYHDPADDPPDLSMDGLVPEETQERWAGRVAGAKFSMIAQKMQEAGKMTEEERQRHEAAIKARFRMAKATGVTFGDAPAGGDK